MQEFTEKDCMQTEKEASIQNRVVVLPSKVLPEHYTGQIFFCTNIQKTENPRHSIAHLVSLSTGEAWHCWNRDVVGVLLPELLGEKERLQLSQIRPLLQTADMTQIREKNWKMERIVSCLEPLPCW